MLRSTLMFVCLTAGMISCSDEEGNEDITTSVNKNGSVESAILVTPLDSAYNILTTTHKVWVKDTVYKTIEYRDTVPALGTQLTTAENSDGDTKTVAVQKEYEIFITVK